MHLIEHLCRIRDEAIMLWCDKGFHPEVWRMLGGPIAH
jgi:hypothetical protein